MSGMTREEAIKNITTYLYAEFENVPKKVIEALEMAIADMEKQIYKKPNKHEEDILGEYYSCPNCSENEINELYDKYCFRCGQALDWSEENDDVYR